MVTRAHWPGSVNEGVVNGLLYILDELHGGVSDIEAYYGSRTGADNGAVRLAERISHVFLEQFDDPSEVHWHR